MVVAPVRADAPRFGTVVVVGGGCYGAYYVRQLRRARDAGAVQWHRLVVVDRDPACRVAQDARDDVTFVAAEWRDWFAQYLGGDASAGDAVVPSPLMPHLFLEWLVARAHARFPEREVAVRTPLPLAGVRWQQATVEGDPRYVSFADWMCPINCVEPAVCPHTRGARDWSLTEAAGGPDTVLFRCLHRAYGVGMIDVQEILDADRELERRARLGPATLTVGTVSHCHGALGTLTVR
jgi:hypothetical protein